MQRKYSIFITIILVVVLTLTIGYSAFGRNLSIEDLAMEVRLYQDIRVTRTAFHSGTENVKSLYDDYNVNSSIMEFELPNEDSSITYDVQVTNLGNIEMGIFAMTGCPSNLVCEITGYKIKDKICNDDRCSGGVQKEFTITIKYAEGKYDVSRTKHDLRLDYVFKRFFTIKYTGIDGSGYPTSIVEEENLNVNFGSNAPDYIEVYKNGNITDEYSYTSGVLNILNVNGNIEVKKTALYKESLLNGTDPIIKGNLIPVTLDGDGTVHYASLYQEWYKYAEQRWANAVILVGSPSKEYHVGDIIKEQDIESYFVWIPRYRYMLWDVGNYTGAYQLSQLVNDATNSPTQLRNIVENARKIEVVFESKAVTPSKGSTVGSYLTHPAFTALNVNGLWVGKFETGYNQNSNTEAPITTTAGWTQANAHKTESANPATVPEKIIIKPNVYSWRNQTISTFFFSAYNYNRTLDSHNMKNTEWGAVAYLSHSAYGIGTKININNNSKNLTGYSATPNTDQTEFLGENGTDSTVTKLYNTAIGYHASTTGNITGIYDMTGGSWEYMSSYVDGYGVKSSGGIASGFTEANLTTYAKYFDKYNKNSNTTTYNYRILGDATGETGPFYLYFEKNGNNFYHSSWYGEAAGFVLPSGPWPFRSGDYTSGILGGQFQFDRSTGGNHPMLGFRLVLSPQ